MKVGVQSGMEIISLTRLSKTIEIKVIAALLVVTAIYLTMDFMVLDYIGSPVQYSVAFYYKLVLCIFFLVAMTSAGSGIVESVCFHFSVSVFSLWFGLSGFLLSDVMLSKYVGLFVVVGGFSLFNILDELLVYLRERSVSGSVSWLLRRFVNIFLFSVFCFALYIFVAGEWGWVIVSPFDW